VLAAATSKPDMMHHTAAQGAPAATKTSPISGTGPQARTVPETPPPVPTKQAQPSRSPQPPHTDAGAFRLRPPGHLATPIAPLDPAMPDPTMAPVAEASGAAAAGAPDRPSAPQPPAPQPVTAQLAQRLGATETLPRGDAPLEMTLDPPELGKIRLSVTRSAEGMVLHLHAELPETLDLLRRHGDALEEELQRHGLEHGAFSFSGGRDGQHPRPAPDPLEAASPGTDGPSPPHPDTAPAAGRGALDLRL